AIHRQQKRKRTTLLASAYCSDSIFALTFRLLTPYQKLVGQAKKQAAGSIQRARPDKFSFVFFHFKLATSKIISSTARRLLGKPERRDKEVRANKPGPI